MATKVQPTEDSTLSSDRPFTLSVAQALTIGSIVLGTVGTIAYAIASFMQTQYIVKTLDDGQRSLKVQVDTIKMRTQIILEHDKILMSDYNDNVRRHLIDGDSEHKDKSVITR